MVADGGRQAIGEEQEVELARLGDRSDVFQSPKILVARERSGHAPASHVIAGGHAEYAEIHRRSFAHGFGPRESGPQPHTRHARDQPDARAAMGRIGVRR